MTYHLLSVCIDSDKYYSKSDQFEDWRDKDVVTGVKDQGQCGSCWAFSATGAIEGQTALHSYNLIYLSEQNLIDCSQKQGNMGCNGGLMDQAFEYVKENNGIDTETSYPYEAKDLSCRFRKEDVGAKDTGFIDLPSKDENALQQAVAKVGPIAVAIDASHSSFHLYKSGSMYLVADSISFHDANRFI